MSGGALPGEGEGAGQKVADDREGLAGVGGLSVSADKDAKGALEGVVKEAAGAQLGHAIGGKDLL